MNQLYEKPNLNEGIRFPLPFMVRTGLQIVQQGHYI